MASLDAVRRSLPSSSWLGVGLLGIIVFVLGVYTPALARFAYAGLLQIALAVAGGAITVLGLSFWWDQRSEERERPVRPPLKGRARELSIAPSLEVYRPGPVERPVVPGESGTGEEPPP